MENNIQSAIGKSRRAAFRLMAKALLFTLSFWAVVVLYLHDDPYMVLRPYRVYDSPVILNENFVGWGIYQNHRNSAHPFNAFIMGNSCTMAYRCAAWEHYLPKGSHAMRLFGNAETLGALNLKLHALERDHAPLRHVFIVMDPNSFGYDKQRSGWEYLLPPEVSGRSWLITQFEMVQTFLMPKFLLPYLRFHITGHLTPSMRYMNLHGRIRNSDNNDLYNPHERLIAKEGEAYWRQLSAKDFPPRKAGQRRSQAYIAAPQERVLRDIAALLKRNHTDYRLIISPDYSQEKLDDRDKQKLYAIFGRRYVFDFTGVNQYTSDYHNYYEKAHYRPVLGNRLLKVVYTASPAR